MQHFVGTAGWTVPKQHLSLFSDLAADTKLSHLQRYATRLRCVEVNSSFYRPHRRSTWERWAASTPADFRFAVKVPKSVTHTARLTKTGGLLLDFLEGVQGLGSKLGPLLVQLPPSLVYDEAIAHEFFTTLREVHAGSVVLEPRHATWFTGAGDRLLRDFAVARVAADPAKASDLAGQPGGSPSLQYWRLHGSPRTYYSDYDAAALQNFAGRIAAASQHTTPEEVWVIFDNTALGHATANAAEMTALLDLED